MSELARAIGFVPPEGWPAMTREECRQRLTAPGQRFEMETVEIGALVGCCFRVMTTSLGGPFRKVGSASTLHALG